jgi:hypothetical protein
VVLTTDTLAEYRKAAEIDSHWPDIRLLIGSLLGVLGRYHEAIDNSRHSSSLSRMTREFFLSWEWLIARRVITQSRYLI